jgi:hypothetical protein
LKSKKRVGKKIETATKFQVKTYFSILCSFSLFLPLLISFSHLICLYFFNSTVCLNVYLSLSPSLSFSLHSSVSLRLYLFSLSLTISLFLSLFFFFLSLFSFRRKRDSRGVCPQKAPKLYLLLPCQSIYTYASSGKGRKGR